MIFKKKISSIFIFTMLSVSLIGGMNQVNSFASDQNNPRYILNQYGINHQIPEPKIQNQIHTGTEVMEDGDLIIVADTFETTTDINGKSVERSSSTIYVGDKKTKTVFHTVYLVPSGEILTTGSFTMNLSADSRGVRQTSGSAEGFFPKKGWTLKPGFYFSKSNSNTIMNKVNHTTNVKLVNYIYSSPGHTTQHVKVGGYTKLKSISGNKYTLSNYSSTY